jgi:hypothetical protein
VTVEMLLAVAVSTGVVRLSSERPRPWGLLVTGCAKEEQRRLVKKR